MPKMYVTTIGYDKYAFYAPDVAALMDVLSRARPVSRDKWKDPYTLGEQTPLVTSVELVDCVEPNAPQEEAIAQVHEPEQSPPSKLSDDETSF